MFKKTIILICMIFISLNSMVLIDASKDFGYNELISSDVEVYVLNGSEVEHNNLTGLQGGISGEYYHIRQSWFDELTSDIFNWITNAEVLNYNYWNNTFATFNKTYADTLYADISITGDNSSWNESYADTIYVDISGDTMTGNLNMGNNNILDINTINITNITYVYSFQSFDGNSINIQPTGDEDDFFSFKTPSDRPTIKREGGKFIYFESSNVYDVGISFREDDTYSGTLAYAKDDNLFKLLGKASPIAIVPNSEYVNYILFETYNNQPQISVFNGSILKINDSLEVIGNGSFNNLTVEGSLFLDGFRLDNLTHNAHIDGSVFGLMMTNPPNQELPHFYIQSGGSGQFSGMVRSWGIVDEQAGFLNSTNRTDCQAYFDVIGEELKIDCNTTTTGADFFVSDDMQVVGDIWIKSSSGNWHFLSRDMQVQEELYNNLLLTEMNGSLSGGILNISSAFGDTIITNINKKEIIKDVTTETISLTSGTNSSPNINYITYEGETPTLTNSLSSPTGNFAEVGRVSLGNGDFVFSSIIDRSDIDGLINGQFNRKFLEGTQYKSGFTTTSSSTEINISTGDYYLLYDLINSSNEVKFPTLSAYIILSNGTYQQINSLEDITEYADGGSITNNKCWNGVWGILNNDLGEEILLLVVQDEPLTEYGSISDAEADKFNTINIFPTGEMNKALFVPIARTITEKVAGTDEFEALSNSLYHFDYRGAFTGTSGSPPSPSITDHNNLNNLDWDLSGHTGNLSLGDYNFSVGTSDLFVNSNTGNIGIGTISPNYELHIEDIISNTSFLQFTTGTTGSGASNGFKIGVDTDDAVYIRQYKNDHIYFYTNNTRKMTILNSGNVGIGTDSPGYALEIESNVANYLLHLDGGVDSSGILVKAGTDASEGAMRLQNSAGTTEILYARSDGNVGIGTTDPADKLHIYSATSNPQLRISSGNTAYDPALILGHTNLTNQGLKLWYDDSIGSTYIDSLFDNAAGDMHFRTRVDGTPIEALFIEADGNVGIGTTSPSKALVVNSTSVAGAGTVELSSNTWGGILSNTAGSNGGNLYLYPQSNIVTVIGNGDVNQNSSFEMYGDGSVKNYFSTNGDSYLMGGDLGIGTSSPVAKLEVYDDSHSAIILGRAGVPNYLGVWNYSSGTMYFGTASSDGVQFRANSIDALLLDINGNTLVQNNFSVGSTDFFVNDNTGNVGIGTSSPNYKLEVAGTGSFGGSTQNGRTLTVNGTGNVNANAAGGLGLTTETGGGFDIYATSTDANPVWDLHTNSAEQMSFSISSAEAMRIDSLGNVGIGTTSPATLLEVNGTGDATHGMIKVSEGSGSDYTYIDPNFGLTVSRSTGYVSNELEGGTLSFRVSESAPFDKTPITLQADGDVIMNAGNVGIGTTSPSYPLEVNANVSDISIYAQANISATGFITRTKLFDKSKNVWDYIKNVDYYKDIDGNIDHSKYYGFVPNITTTDRSRPINETYEEEVCVNVLVNKTVEKCTWIEDVLTNCTDVIEEVYEIQCHNETRTKITYPYTKKESGVDIESEINVLRQAIYELKQENDLLKIRVEDLENAK